MNDRILAAQERLHVALLSGEDTEPHRRAIEALTTKQQAAVTLEQQKMEERRREINEAVSARAEVLDDETLARLASVTRKFQIPEKP